MSDTCYWEADCKPAHQGQFEQFVSLEKEDRRDISRYEVHEANYGYYTEMEKAAEAGLIFVGSHGAGGGYGAAAFFGYGGELFHEEVSQTNPMSFSVRFDHSGEANADDLNRIAKFIRLRAKAVAALYEPAETEEGANG